MRVEVPSLTDLEELLGDTGLSDFSLSPVTTPVKTSTQSASIASQTVNNGQLSDEDWPTLSDSNTGSKPSRIGRLPTRIGYKPIRMERISSIRVCRFDSGGPMASYRIPKLTAEKKEAVDTTIVSSSWLSQQTKKELEKAMATSRTQASVSTAR